MKTFGGRGRKTIARSIDSIRHDQEPQLTAERPHEAAERQHEPTKLIVEVVEVNAVMAGSDISRSLENRQQRVKRKRPTTHHSWDKVSDPETSGVNTTLSGGAKTMAQAEHRPQHRGHGERHLMNNLSGRHR